MALLPCVEINPDTNPAISIIWLHGLGADGHDFAPIVPSLNLPADKPVRFVFPHAPNRPVTINNGYVMPAWFDILTLERSNPTDEAGILETITQIEALIQREIKQGVPANKIILAGFSQGGAIALLTALRHPETLGGVMGLSTYLPLQDSLSKNRSDANAHIPVFMAHGLHDPVLNISLGTQSRDFLLAHDYTVEWHEYPMEHSVDQNEIADISQWLKSLPAFA